MKARNRLMAVCCDNILPCFDLQWWPTVTTLQRLVVEGLLVQLRIQLRIQLSVLTFPFPCLCLGTLGEQSETKMTAGFTWDVRRKKQI